MIESVLVVGASLAGHAVARALRSEGFAGQVTVVGDEPYRPYDRPPLSKGFLLGSCAEPDLLLESDDEQLDVDWVFGVTATSLDPETHTVTLADGRVLTADAVVVATGSRARRITADTLPGVHRLRSLDDALALRTELLAGNRLVVVGGGLIGSEVAATAAALGVDVTIIETQSLPMARVLGPAVGQAMVDLHVRHGVTVRCATGVREIVGDATGSRVTGVRLDDGTVLPADVVVEAIGSLPNVEWLTGSGLEIEGGVRCSAYGRTGTSRVYAVGDCSAWFDNTLGRHHRTEHWTDCTSRATTVAKAILVDASVRIDDDQTPAKAPYFWSDQYNVRIQFAGRTTGAETFTIEQGSFETDDLLGVFRSGGSPVAVVAINQPRAFGRWRRSLVTVAPETTPETVQ